MTTILAEYRAGTKVVLFERVTGRFDSAYRVSVYQRSRSRAVAQKAFLSEVPPTARANLLKQIENSKGENEK